MRQQERDLNEPDGENMTREALLRLVDAQIEMDHQRSCRDMRPYGGPGYDERLALL